MEEKKITVIYYNMCKRSCDYMSHTWALVCDGSHIQTSSQLVCFIYTSGGVKSL